MSNNAGPSRTDGGNTTDRSSSSGGGGGGGGGKGVGNNAGNNTNNNTDSSRLVKRHLTTESAYAILDAHKLFQDAAVRSSGNGEVRAAVGSLAGKEPAIRGSLEVRVLVNSTPNLTCDEDKTRTRTLAGHPLILIGDESF
jgi:hypothetical protein